MFTFFELFCRPSHICCSDALLCCHNSYEETQCLYTSIEFMTYVNYLILVKYPEHEGCKL